MKPNNNKDLLSQFRYLEEHLHDARVVVVNAMQEDAGVTLEKQIEHMIKTYPEIWGKGGLMRTWLESKYPEFGDISPADSGGGVYNMPKGDN